MTGPARALALTICAASPASGGSQLWVCGRKPGHTGNHIDVEGLGMWPADAEVTP